MGKRGMGGGGLTAQGPEKCNPAEHRTPEQAALFADDDEEGGGEGAGKDEL
jgi:hypothetical protein